MREENVAVEIHRCLDCFDPPCEKACPASIAIPSFIRAMRTGDLQRAARIVRKANPMAATCGAICPEEVFCQSVCTRGKLDEPVRIRELHEFATGFDRPISTKVDFCGWSVAVVGSGPAGLSCALRLAENDVKVDVYERAEHPGGLLAGVVPGLRLPQAVLQADVDFVASKSVKFVLGTSVKDPADLLKVYQAVFMAPGLETDRRLDIAGEESVDVVPGLTFLQKAGRGELRLLKGKRVIVIGGGNVSMDVASTAAELGASEVRLLYRRGPQEIRIWQSGLEETRRRGVVIDYLASPLELVFRSGKLSGVKCISMRLLDQRDSDDRRCCEPLPETEFHLPADTVVAAVGLTSNYKRDIHAGEGPSTSVEGVFAGGDWVRGEGTVVEAVRDGKTAADAILAFLMGKRH
ncbi:MAG: FAD-dependent oxidoreductase [Candidatus Eisenbacteria bacterium]